MLVFAIILSLLALDFILFILPLCFKGHDYTKYYIKFPFPTGLIIFTKLLIERFKQRTKEFHSS